MKKTVLLYQYKPAIRMYKIGKTLVKRGFEVMYSGKAAPFEYYDLPFTKTKTLEQLQQLSQDYHTVIFGNPNHPWCTDLDHPRKICAVGDVCALRENSPEHTAQEEQTFAELDGFIFVSREQQQAVENYFGVGLGADSIVIHNGILREWLPEIKCKLVWSGNLLHSNRSNHREILPRLVELADCSYLEIHLYPGQVNYPGDYLAGLPDNIILHKRVRPQDLIKELSQYDAGLCLFNITAQSKPHLDTALPNKLFEYRAAGLFVYCDDLEAMREYGDNDDCVMVADLDMIKDYAKGFVCGKEAWRRVVSYDDQAEDLEGFILQQSCRESLEEKEKINKIT